VAAVVWFIFPQHLKRSAPADFTLKLFIAAANGEITHKKGGVLNTAC
jgi:hypothetical protein